MDGVDEIRPWTGLVQRLEHKEVNVKRQRYLACATRRLLDGTRHRIPVEAVAAGVRTLEVWVSILDEERELERTRIQAPPGSDQRSGKGRTISNRRHLL